MEVQEDKMLRTPQGLLNNLLSEPIIIDVLMMEFFSEGKGTLVITIKPKFWCRLRCVVFSDYATKVKGFYSNKAKQYIPEEVTVEIILGL